VTEACIRCVSMARPDRHGTGGPRTTPQDSRNTSEIGNSVPFAPAVVLQRILSGFALMSPPDEILSHYCFDALLLCSSAVLSIWFQAEKMNDTVRTLRNVPNAVSTGTPGAQVPDLIPQYNFFFKSYYYLEGTKIKYCQCYSQRFEHR
jgi:hypothetical protein